MGIPSCVRLALFFMCVVAGSTAADANSFAATTTFSSSESQTTNESSPAIGMRVAPPGLGWISIVAGGSLQPPWTMASLLVTTVSNPPCLNASFNDAVSILSFISDTPFRGLILARLEWKQARAVSAFIGRLLASPPSRQAWYQLIFPFAAAQTPSATLMIRLSLRAAAASTNDDEWIALSGSPANETASLTQLIGAASLIPGSNTAFGSADPSMWDELTFKVCVPSSLRPPPPPFRFIHDLLRQKQRTFWCCTGLSRGCHGFDGSLHTSSAGRWSNWSRARPPASSAPAQPASYLERDINLIHRQLCIPSQRERTRNSSTATQSATATSTLSLAAHAAASVLPFDGTSCRLAAVSAVSACAP